MLSFQVGYLFATIAHGPASTAPVVGYLAIGISNLYAWA